MPSNMALLQIYEDVTNWVWNEHFWLPANATWDDLKRDETIFIPRPADLLFTVPMALFLFTLRLLWERTIASYIGNAYNLRNKPNSKPVENEDLERGFKQHRKILPSDKHELERLSAASGFTTRQVERWWRRRRTLGKPSEMQRFRETSWRCIFYFCSFHYGLYVLWNAPWFADTKHCWYGYPKQHVSDWVYWYYMVELGFYLSLIISLFMDERRKDFWEMMIHHVATLTLMFFSWGNNMVRIGTLVLCIHDAVDYWLEGAKVAKYLRYQKLCDVMFVIFTANWFITRLVIFPYKVVYSAVVESKELIGHWPGHAFINSFLIVLQVLHFIWFYMIFRILVTYIIVGKVKEPRQPLPIHNVAAIFWERDPVFQRCFLYYCNIIYKYYISLIQTCHPLLTSPESHFPNAESPIFH